MVVINIPPETERGNEDTRLRSPSSAADRHIDGAGPKSFSGRNRLASRDVAGG
ncbi:hypothetical protein [Candidatus Hamiltonella defensa]|uniref:hypothetical protein n=1 Tax=Candidatus Williamhamiltonella defendens TaxID=138072 RepID=UPI0030DBDEAF